MDGWADGQMLLFNTSAKEDFFYVVALTNDMEIIYFDNIGYFKDESVIRDEMTRKKFYRGMDIVTEKYSYAEIWQDYYFFVTKPVSR